MRVRPAASAGGTALHFCVCLVQKSVGQTHLSIRRRVSLLVTHGVWGSGSTGKGL